MTSLKSGDELKNELLARLKKLISTFASTEKLSEFETGQVDALEWVKQIVEEEM